jgi:hypothetical protein
MKLFKLKINTDDLSGTITLELPNYQEKADISKKLKIGDASVSDLDQLVIIMGEIRPRIKDVDLVVKEGGQEIKEFDDLEYLTEGQDVIKQVSTAFLGGVSLGKILK